MDDKKIMEVAHERACDYESGNDNEFSSQARANYRTGFFDGYKQALEDLKTKQLEKLKKAIVIGLHNS